MKPITFTCDETLPLPSDDIARQILNLTKWPDFQGYGPIPKDEQTILMRVRKTIKTYLELMQGDKREQETAAQLRKTILQRLQKTG